MADETVELVMEGIEDSHSKKEGLEVKESDEDESSIEALTWSDFDEEELEVAKKLAEQEFPTVPLAEQQLEASNWSETSTVNNESKDTDEESQKSLVIISGQDAKDDNNVQDIVHTEATTSIENPNNESLISLSNELFACSNSAVIPREDSVSNAPVLDDGPIWGKGEKSYKFHENRKINQKLTLGVLISVVLAVGIGVGNLVAYNEYETEIPMRCSPPIRSTRQEETVSSGLLSSHQFKNNRHEHTHSAFSDPDVTSKTTLAYVVKSIDELAKKFDQFQNTTKQLGGIVVIRDDPTEHTRRKKIQDESNAFLEQEFEKLGPIFVDETDFEKRTNKKNVNFADFVNENVKTSHEVKFGFHPETIKLEDSSLPVSKPSTKRDFKMNNLKYTLKKTNAEEFNDYNGLENSKTGEVKNWDLIAEGKLFYDNKPNKKFKKKYLSQIPPKETWDTIQPRDKQTLKKKKSIDINENKFSGNEKAGLENQVALHHGENFFVVGDNPPEKLNRKDSRAKKGHPKPVKLKKQKAVDKGDEDVNLLEKTSRKNSKPGNSATQDRDFKKNKATKRNEAWSKDDMKNKYKKLDRPPQEKFKNSKKGSYPSHERSSIDETVDKKHKRQKYKHTKQFENTRDVETVHSKKDIRKKKNKEVGFYRRD